MSAVGLERLLGASVGAGSGARLRHSIYDTLDTASTSIIATSSRRDKLAHVWAQARGTPLRTVIGLLLFMVAVALLVWNERHAVLTSQSLDEGYNKVVSLPMADVLLPENEGKVVHVSGALATFPPLADYLYNVEISAVRLKRRVQMLQWVEEEETFESEPSPLNRESSPHSVTYSYSTMWKDKLVDSGLFNIPFGHENPSSFPLQSEIHTTEVVKIGAYLLSPEIVDTFTTYRPFSGDEEPTADDVKLHAGLYYQTKDIFSPEVGDVRVQFYYAGHAGDTYSIIGIQRGSSLVPYTSSSGQQLVLLQAGQRSPEEVFATHHAHTRLHNWSLRILAFCILCLAIAFTHHVVHAAACMVQLLRDVCTMSGGHFTMTVAMSLSLAIIALSWCVYRPGLAVCLVLLAVLPAVKSGHSSVIDTFLLVSTQLQLM